MGASASPPPETSRACSTFVQVGSLQLPDQCLEQQESHISIPDCLIDPQKFGDVRVAEMIAASKSPKVDTIIEFVCNKRTAVCHSQNEVHEMEKQADERGSARQPSPELGGHAQVQQNARLLWAGAIFGSLGQLGFSQSYVFDGV